MIPLLPEDVIRYLADFRQQYALDQIVNYLDGLRDLSVVVLGEAIIDEYVYCDALGKSGKEAMLAMKYVSQEQYAGGSLAIANHLTEFCQQITLISYLGANNSHEDFIRAHLKPEVTPRFIYKADAPTIVKRRFLDRYTRSKLLGVYEINDEYLHVQEEQELCGLLHETLPTCDLVIVADYDHGLITPRIVQLLSTEAPFLAVNTQVNAANIGFHSISKYHRADFICANENEIRMDRRNRNGDLPPLVQELAERMKCPAILITRGNNGTLLYRKTEGVTACPSFAVKVIDRIGAGDAVLSIASLLSVKGVPADILSFISNLVGAEAVGIIGNKRSLDKSQLIRSIKSFLLT